MNHSDPDERWLGAIVHGAFFLLLGSSFARFLSRDQGGAHTGWVVALFAFFCALYVLGHLVAPPGAAAHPASSGLAGLGHLRLGRPAGPRAERHLVCDAPVVRRAARPAA